MKWCRNAERCGIVFGAGFALGCFGLVWWRFLGCFVVLLVKCASRGTAVLQELLFDRFMFHVQVLLWFFKGSLDERLVDTCSELYFLKLKIYILLSKCYAITI